MKEPQSDHDLIQRYQSKGDQESFGEVYLRHRETVYRLIAKIVLDEGVAQELTQDTFMKACTKIHQYKGTASFKTWLCRIAVNGANEHLRKLIRSRNHLELLQNGERTRPPSTSPRDSLFWKEETQRVSEALQRLEPELRTALVLTVLEEMDPREAAKIQGCTRSTLYWRVHKARKVLKEGLGYA